MATETVVSDHSPATDEQVEKKVNEEVKAIEQYSVASSMESVEEEKPAEESPSPATPLSKPEEVSKDKQIAPPVAEVEKTDGAPGSDVPVEDNLKGEKDSISDSHAPSVPEPIADTIKTQPEEQPALEPIADTVKSQPEEQPALEPVADTVKTQPEEQPAIESAVSEATEQLEIASKEQGEEEKPNIVDVPESIVEATEKLEEPLDVIPSKETEAVVEEEIKNPDLGSIKVEKPEDATTEAEGKAEEQSEVTKQVEETYVEVEPKESVEVDTAKDIGTLADEVENTTLLKGGQTDKEEESSVIRTSEQDPINQETQTDLKEDGEDSSLPITVSKNVDAEEKKELSGAEVVGELSKEAVLEAAEENETKTVETEDENEKRTVIFEEPTQPIEVEDVSSSISTAEVIEKSFEGENTNRDEKKESSGAEVVGELSKDAVLEVGKAAEENETKTVETEEENEKRKLIPEEPTQPIEVEDASSSISTAEVTEKSFEGENTNRDEKKELSGAEVIEELSKEAVVEAGKAAEENEAKTGENEEENEKGNVIHEESTLPIKVEHVNSSTSTTEVIEKSFEGENTNRDEKKELSGAEVIEELSKEAVVEAGKAAEENEAKTVENKTEENVKDEIPALVETKKDEQAEKREAEVTTVVSEPLKESQESNLQVRGEETVETDVDKLEKEKVDEIANSDVQNLEPSINVDDETKTSQDLPKEVPAKPAQKQSNNIISKVKQSLVKAKKAIIGKSLSSKTLSSETKGDIKVK